MMVYRGVGLLASVMLTVLTLSGCVTCDSGPALYVRGSMKSEISSHGTFISTTRKVQEQYKLARPGDSFDVAEGVPFQLTVPGVVNLGTNALRITQKDTVVAGPPVYTVSLVESCNPYVVMDRKCKIVNWYNPYRIPEVRIRNSDAQLIMTPLLDPSDAIIGYEIRLGDHKDCGSPALRRLQRSKHTTFAPVRSNTKDTPWELSSLEGAKPE